MDASEKGGSFGSIQFRLQLHLFLPGILFCFFFFIFSLPFYVFPFRGEGKEDTGIGEFLNNLHVSCFTLLALIKHNNNNRGRLSYNNNNIRVCINTKYNGELLLGFFASFFTLFVQI